MRWGPGLPDPEQHRRGLAAAKEILGWLAAIDPKLMEQSQGEEISL